ncbi:MAG TPA: HAMP domain-containing protein [Chloroflexi bacterium]|nr:HAMP domain-containing protein [Chloroflexota bacterium]
MHGSLFWKLVAAFGVVIMVGVGGALLLAGLTTEAEFRRYAHGSNAIQWEETVAELAAYYAAHGSWDGVEAAQPGSRGQGQGRGAGGGGSGPPLRLADADGRVQFSRPDSGNEVGRTVGATELEAGWPILVDGRRVGTLLPGGEGLTAEQQDFLTRTRWALALSGGGALVVALVLGGLLARGIARPLGRLAAASQAVAGGDLTVRVPIASRDEIGRLSAAFNRMAADLEQAEEARRQQAADIAHELRTPLTVVQGHLEAFADGVFPADLEHLNPALEQVQLLGRLVEDLRTLSLADAGRLTLTAVFTDVREWVERTVAGFHSAAAARGVGLAVEGSEGLDARWVEMDVERMTQVLGNLLDNGLRHTPPGGRITVALALQKGAVVVSVTDGGPGVPTEHLAHLFERFWRGDPSRSRRTGGSGLGLAIAQRIVEAHGGRMWAENAPPDGLRVSFSLPTSPSSR